MAVNYQTIDVPLGAGLDTKTNEKLLKPPAAADLVDAIFPASGVAGYETRHGYTKIDTATTVTDVRSLPTRGQELCVLTKNKLYSVSELANNTDLIDRGDLISCSVNESTLDTQAVNQTQGGVIEHAGLRVYCWFDSSTSDLKYTVEDLATGSVILADQDVTNGVNPKLCYTSDSIMLVYFNDSANSIRAVIIPTYAPSSVSNVELQSDASADGLFDVIESGNGETVFCAYKQNTPATYAFLFDGGGNTSQKTSGAGTADPDCIAVAVNTGTQYFVVTCDSPAIHYYYSDGFASLGTFSFGTNVRALAFDNVACVYNPTDDRLKVWAQRAGTSIVEFHDNLNALGVDATHYNAYLASNAFLLGGVPCVHLAHSSTLQSQYFLCSVNSAFNIAVQAKCCVGTGVTPSAGYIPRVVDNLWAPVFRERLTVDVDPDVAETAANVYAQYGLKRVKYDDSFSPGSVEYGAACYINSGVLWQYDGRQLVEQGFHIYPEGITLNSTPADSSGLEAASYTYRVYYEWTNARGERQRSTTGELFTVDTSDGLVAGDDIVLNIPTLSFTEKGTDVSIVVYRTESNPNIVGGAPFYRVSSPDPSTAGSDNGYLANSLSAATVTFRDALADSALIQKELDYLNSGELDNVSPRSASVIGEAKKRVLLAGFERDNELQYSKLNARRRDQLEFHDGLQLDVPEEDGPITAFAELKHFMVVFKANSCYAISGEGPNNLGSGFFNIPQIVSLDVGCIEPRSVVNVPLGVMFKSNKGIWLLGQNLDMQYIGADVELYNSQTITAATVIPDQNHVLFLTNSGSTLCYNYLVGAWSRFSNHEGVAATLWNGTYVYARTDGKLYKQSATQYSDDGVHYSMKFTTAPITLRGVQGRQFVRSLRLLGEYYSPHNLRVGIKYDHESGVSDYGTWNPADALTISLYGEGAYGAGAYSGSGSTVYQARFNLPRIKCESVQFVIDSTNTGNAGRAMSIQALQIEAGIDKAHSHELSVDASFSATGRSTAE